MSRIEFENHLKNVYKFLNLKHTRKALKYELEQYATSLETLIYKMDELTGHKNWKIETI